MKTDGQPLTIIADNLSLAWGQVALALTQPGVTHLAPLTLIVRGFDEQGVATEVPAIRAAVDAFLAAHGKRDTENVAWTLFPQRYWELSNGDREAFYSLFIESFARIQDFNPRNNRRGSYFQRLVDLNGEGKGPNQLKWMLDQYIEHPNSRRTSKFQATTFDPVRDYTSTGQLEFPCLQQISFTFEKGAVHLNAFYATQQIARKGYGNYLGLARLGAFAAGQMGLRFEQLNVFVGVAKMDCNKTDAHLGTVMNVVRQHLPPSAESNIAA
jgi:hypothetical protein